MYRNVMLYNCWQVIKGSLYIFNWNKLMNLLPLKNVLTIKLISCLPEKYREELPCQLLLARVTMLTVAGKSYHVNCCWQELPCQLLLARVIMSIVAGKSCITSTIYQGIIGKNLYYIYVSCKRNLFKKSNDWQAKTI